MTTPWMGSQLDQRKTQGWRSWEGVEGFCLGWDGGIHLVQQLGSPIISKDAQV